MLSVSCCSEFTVINILHILLRYAAVISLTPFVGCKQIEAARLNRKKELAAIACFKVAFSATAAIAFYVNDYLIFISAMIAIKITNKCFRLLVKALPTRLVLTL